MKISKYTKLKAVSILLCMFISFTVVLSGCNYSKSKSGDNGQIDKTVAVPDNEFRAIWISMYDYNIKGLNYDGFRERIDSMLDNTAELGINTVFVHVRAYGDAYYKSAYFPWSANITGNEGLAPEYDPLEYMVTAAHSRNIKIHAWVNPLRISSTNDTSSLCKDNIAYKYLCDENTENDLNIMEYDGRYYLNPAEDDCRLLILNGIKELCENYKIDGIHFDDYFYPANDEDLDAESYRKYCENTKFPLSLTKWRTANISKLIASVYRTVKSYSLKFGISPSGQISGEYLTVNGYADVKNWLSSNGYIDYLIPQIYWGYEHPVKDCTFEKCLDNWCSLKRNKNVDLYVGLAGYKIGTHDNSSEWEENTNIIARQIVSARRNNLTGFSIFSYTSVFSPEKSNTEERENIKSVLK